VLAASNLYKVVVHSTTFFFIPQLLEINMKLIHIVMTINFVLLALFGTWTYSLITTTQHQYQCTTDTECEEEEANLSKGK
jgi:hypothetical protein